MGRSSEVQGFCCAILCGACFFCHLLDRPDVEFVLAPDVRTSIRVWTLPWRTGSPFGGSGSRGLTKWDAQHLRRAPGRPLCSPRHAFFSPSRHRKANQPGRGRLGMWASPWTSCSQSRLDPSMGFTVCVDSQPLTRSRESCFRSPLHPFLVRTLGFWNSFGTAEKLCER